MSLFILGLVILMLGYISYGRMVEYILKPDDRKTPAFRLRDNIDYLPLPTWKNCLIHLLNIAGVGPVLGVIAGIKFGAIVFVIIPIGNIIGGATYDYISGFYSLRHDGENLPIMAKNTAGNCFYNFFNIFLNVALLLIVTVFINTPALLLSNLFAGKFLFIIILAIFLYYILATLMPIDKIIGKIYPIFGALLLLGTGLLLISVIRTGFQNPELLEESPQFIANMFTPEKNQPVIPLLFVTIACGILSGFHATQAPIVARTMKSEREARLNFYGMMLLEGIIAMVWAAAAMIIYNKFPEMMSNSGPIVLQKITSTLLRPGLNVICVLSVVILSITSGDTAMRSIRLSIAECLKIDQKKISNRLIIVIPTIAIVSLLLLWSNKDAKGFGILWNYFAWANQVIAALVLLCCVIWMTETKRPVLFALFPSFFINAIVVTFILWTSPSHGGPIGLGLDIKYAAILGCFFSMLFNSWAITRGLSVIDKERTKKSPNDK